MIASALEQGPIQRWGCRLLVMLFISLFGCGKPLPLGKVRVRGVVIHDGKHLTLGSISLAATKGTESVISRIGADGGFEVVVSPGEYAVAVVSKDGFDTMDEQGKVRTAESFVPQRYASTSTSGLRVTIPTDSQPMTLELTP